MRDLCDRLGIIIETRTHAVSACSADAVVPVGVRDVLVTSEMVF